MTKAKNMYPEMKTIKQDINHLKEDAADLAQHVKEHGVHRAEVLKDQASETYEAAVKEGADELKRIEKYVTSNPAQSVAIAFAAGVLASFLFGRR